MYLNHVGFSVRAVADGQAGIDAAVELRPDVIVMGLSGERGVTRIAARSNEEGSAVGAAP